MPKKILVVTPRFPLPPEGADEQDRFEGVKQLKRLGFNIRVLAKVFSFQDRDAIRRFSSEFNIPVTLLEYESEAPRSFAKRILFYVRRFANPFYWDGAAYEYSHLATRSAFQKILAEWKPDILWFDYTYLWPLYLYARAASIPIITRSINFEPIHFLQEDGYSLWNFFKAVPKFASECLMVLKSDWIFAITPREEAIYRRLGARAVSTLPLRGLPRILATSRAIVEKPHLDVFFAGSTYTVPHNLKALEFMIREIIPQAEKKAPGIFTFHITGAKLPSRIRAELPSSAIYHGFIGEWENFLRQMDVAIVPSLFGAGMQQKIFEPLSRGIPTVASMRGLAGYPFRHREHLWGAATPGDFVDGLLAFRDVRVRARLSKNAIEVCCNLFSMKTIDTIILNADPFRYVRH